MKPAIKPNTNSFLSIPEESGAGRAFGLSALMHALLIVFLCYGLYWKNNASSGVEVELWSAMPDEQPAVTPPALAPAPAMAPPAPRLFSMPQTEQADISLRQDPKPASKRTPPSEGMPSAKQSAPSTVLKANQQATRKPATREDISKTSSQKSAAKQQELTKKEQQRVREQLIREMKAFETQRAQERAQHKRQDRLDNLRQMATTSQGNAQVAGGQTGVHAGSGGAGGPGYADQVRQRVRPNIVFNAQEVAGNPQAVVEVDCAPDGAILNIRLVRSSGNSAWDNAILRAVEKSDPMPRRDGKQAPKRFAITFQPKD